MRWPALLGALALAGCGLALVGTAPGEPIVAGGDAEPVPAPPDAAPTFDGGAIDAPAPSDAPTSPDAIVTGTCDAGAAVIVLAPDAGACPAGTTEQVAYTSPVVASGACTCGACTPVTNPSCAGNNLRVSWGSSNACGAGSDMYNITDNACIDWGYGSFTLVDYHGWMQRAPAAGTCTATAVADISKVTATAVRQCVGGSAGAVCAAEAAGERLCVPSGGAACGGSYPVTLAVGDVPTLACGACACSRTATSCTVEYHGNSSCTQLRYTAQANGQCVRTNNASGVQYLKVFPTGVTCNATPGNATPGVTNARTLCCNR